MASETQKTMVRFDFPPGATAEKIAAALTALRDRVRREKAEARARADRVKLLAIVRTDTSR
jgi:hypothetical protein